MNRRLYQQAPRALRHAQSDNISIVPASLLPHKARYQAIANQFPQGDVLLVVSPTSTTQPLLATIAERFRQNGRRVHTVRLR